LALIFPKPRPESAARFPPTMLFFSQISSLPKTSVFSSYDVSCCVQLMIFISKPSPQAVTIRNVPQLSYRERIYSLLFDCLHE
jgi:hypothetical protein